ncbi:MAG: hypothetical protein JWP91_778 [Fibrobacteres bacterium]|nr:hypothetical protein [Fibrobacterota bacterium]
MGTPNPERGATLPEKDLNMTFKANYRLLGYCTRITPMGVGF